MKDILEKISYNNIVSALLLIIASFVLTKLGAALLKKLAERYSQKRIQITTLIPIYKLLVNVSVLSFIGFGIFSISGQTLMALGLSLGVALGFAFQDLLGNIFGGLIIIFTKPFAIGDKIQIGQHYGEVKDISLRRLEIVTIDDSVISIPNKAILTEHIANANTGELNCQVVTDIFLPLDIDFNRARQVALEAVYSSPYVFLKKPVAVTFRNQMTREAHIIMKIRAYVFDHRFEFAFISDITQRVCEHLSVGSEWKKGKEPVSHH